MKPVGVIYNTFQIADLSDMEVTLRLLQAEYSTLVFVLPVKRFPNSKDAPLDYETRALMIHETIPSAIVVPLPETKYSENFPKLIEGLVNPFLRPMSAVFFFASKVTLDAYTRNGGKWNTCQSNACITSLIDTERNYRDSVTPDASVQFRRGAIYANATRFPISHMTVDMAILRTNERKDVDDVEFKPKMIRKKQLLLGKKPGEKSWRFPGGFKDRKDQRIEDAVLREGMEEVIAEKDQEWLPSMFFSEPRYLGSRNIADWRYAGDRDGITTVFYEMDFIGSDDDICAGDDLAEVQWFDLDKMTENFFVGEHQHLWKLFMEKHQ